MKKLLVPLALALVGALAILAAVLWRGSQRRTAQPPTVAPAAASATPPLARAPEAGRVAKDFASHDRPGFDLRETAAVAPAKLAPPAAVSREQAAERLRQMVPGVRVDFDQRLGTPQFIASNTNYLTGANGEGRAVPAERVQQFDENTPHRAVKAFIAEHAALFGHGPELLETARVQRDYTTGHNGLRTTVWQQDLDGIRVFESTLQAHVTNTGALVNVASRLVPDARAAAAAGTPEPERMIAQPAVDARAAISAAAATVGDTVPAGRIVAAAPAEGASQKQKFRAQALLDLAAEYVWLPMNGDAMRLCWEVIFVSKKRGEMFRTLVDAGTGKALVQHRLTEYISPASYRVFTSDSPTPGSPGPATPQSTQPPVVARTLVTLDALDTTASPDGWIPDGGNETVGNNVDAHLDVNQDNLPDLPRPQGSPSRVFDPALDLAQAPGTYGNAAVVDLFFWNNRIHDRFYQLGFTEAAGNFQTNNFGRGGVGNDAVQADAQDGSGTNNANFSTPPDGSPGRMQMYVFTGPDPDRDGDFDHEIVIHEYTHGLSNRLVGGGVGMSALQSRGMGEGWSDFYGLCLLSEAGDDVNGNYAAGAYATLSLSGMTTNYYFGIRRYPYSTNLLTSPLTFRDIDPTQASPHTGVPLSPRYTSSNSDPSAVHGQGSVWCTVLWDARANLVSRLGHAGNELILRLVTDGMKLAPANPNFLQARDAILQAELVYSAGANRNDLWAAFAKRGMGANATSPASSTTTGIVESYDLPDDLGVSPSAGFSSRGPVGGPFDVNSITFTFRNNGSAPLNWTATDNAPWLTLSQSGGTLAPAATTTVVATLTGGAALADGIYSGAMTVTNTTSGIVQTRNFSLLVGQPDYFTELFDSSPNDTASQSFTFLPNGSSSFYRATRETAAAFPTNPAGGASLAMSDDTFAAVTLTGGASVSLYGTSYTTLYVGSNGYVTFVAGDTTFSETLGAHFTRPRISAHFSDLLPSTGQVTWRQLADRAAVTWQNVPEYGTSNSNSFQIEMFFDGRVRITILNLSATGGLIGLSRGTGLPAGFSESDFSSYGPAQGLTVTAPAAVLEGPTLASMPPHTGTVTAGAAPTADLTVNLTSGIPADLSVPASVTILAGQTSAVFPITVVDDLLLNGSRSVQIAATAVQYASGATNVVVDDNETAALTLSVPASATEGGAPMTGTVTMSAPAGANVAVTLAANDPSEVLLPATATILAGQTSGTFSFTARDDGEIDGPVAVTLTASVTNWTSGTANISILDSANTNLALSFPIVVREGDGTKTGTVQISGTLPAALTVFLSSDDTTEIILPASVTIPAGQTTAPFTATVVDDIDADGASPVTLTASAASFTNAAAGTTVQDNDAHHFTIGPIAAAQIPNQPFAATVTAKDVNDVTITNFNGPVALTAAGTGGAMPITPAVITAWAGGVFSGNIAVSAPGTSIVVTANDGQGHTGTSNAFDAIIGPFHHFGWSPIASPQFRDTPFAVTVSAQDVANNTVGSFAGTAVLTAHPSAAGAPLAIVPATTGAFTNGVWSGSVHLPFALADVRLRANDGAGHTGDSNTFTITTPAPPVSGSTILSEPFESGVFGAWWTITGTSTFRTIVTTANAPHAGTRHMTMDSTTDSSYARNEATLTVNLAGRTSVQLSFWAKIFSDEANTPPASPFVGGADFDGVAISADGTNWYEVQSLRTPTVSGTWAQLTVNLDAAIAARGLTYNSTFKIRFNQYDNFAISTDGIAIDDILITATTATTTSVSLPAQVTEGSGNQTGTVTLAGPAAADTTIALASSAPAKLSVPPSVLVPSGQSSAPFTFHVPDDTFLDGNKSIFVAATAPGETASSATTIVVDDDITTLAISAPASAAEGSTANGTVTLGAAPSGTVTVNLASSVPTAATVPATVTFTPGQTSATFVITPVNDTAIDGTQTTTITASVAGWIPAGTSIQIIDNENTNLTLTGATTVAEGGTATGTVNLSGTLTSNLVVALSSATPAQLTVPASAIILAGATSANFTITGVDDAVTDGAQAITVTATAASFTTATRNVTVLDNDVHHFTFNTIAATQTTNLPFNTTISARDVNDLTIAAFTGTAALTAANGGGPVTMTPATTTAFSNGSWTGGVTVTQPGANIALTATAAGATGSSNAFTVANGAVIARTPAALSLSLIQGATDTRTLAISNPGGQPLNWQIATNAFALTASTGPEFTGDAPSSAEKSEPAPAASAPIYRAPRTASAVPPSVGPPPLAFALANLNSNSNLVRSAIPTRYAFTEGVTGTSIGDGGNDMYDTGNILRASITPAGTLSYSDNVIATSALLGVGGQYFTRKFDGLFVIGADVSGLSYFEITGGLGADGSGSTDSAILTATHDGVNYRGFVKRVYAAGDPSVNHLIIVPDNGTVTHEASTDTNNDYHRVTGMTGITRIYHVLYAGTSGAYINNTAAQGIMSAFLDAIAAPDWITPGVSSGTVAPGASQDVGLTINPGTLAAGSYSRTLIIASNDLGQPTVTTTVSLTVSGDADADGLPDAWETAYGLDPADNGSSNPRQGAAGDFDFDGIANLIEHALALNPSVPQPGALTTCAIAVNPADGLSYLTFSYRRRIAAGAFTFTPECATTLGTWDPAPANFQHISATPVGDGVAENVTVRVLPAVGANPATFVRLRVTTP